jgi:Golgi nucleoside diphosphatase
VIVTSPVNLDFNNNYSFSGGSALVYGSDLVISLGHGYLRINKNRNGYQDEKISFEELDLELEKIAYI